MLLHIITCEYILLHTITYHYISLYNIIIPTHVLTRANAFIYLYLANKRETAICIHTHVNMICIYKQTHIHTHIYIYNHILYISMCIQMYDMCRQHFCAGPPLFVRQRLLKHWFPVPSVRWSLDKALRRHEATPIHTHLEL